MIDVKRLHILFLSPAHMLRQEEDMDHWVIGSMSIPEELATCRLKRRHRPGLKMYRPPRWVEARPPWLVANLHLPEEEVEPLATLLAADEFARAERFHFPADRRRFIAGRAILRLLLGSCLQLAPQSCASTMAPPESRPWTHARIGVTCASMSRMPATWRSMASCGSRKSVSTWNTRPAPSITLDIAGHFFSPAENQVIRSLPPAAQIDAFYSYWTRKEAYVKGIGSGLGLPLDQFTVPLATAAPVQVCGKVGSDERTVDSAWVTSNWLVYDVHVPPGYFAALAVDGEISELRQWEVTCRGRRCARQARQTGIGAESYPAPAVTSIYSPAYMLDMWPATDSRPHRGISSPRQRKASAMERDGGHRRFRRREAEPRCRPAGRAAVLGAPGYSIASAEPPVFTLGYIASLLTGKAAFAASTPARVVW